VYRCVQGFMWFMGLGWSRERTLPHSATIEKIPSLLVCGIVIRTCLKKRALIVSDSNGRNACVILHVSLLWYFVVTLSSRLRKVTWPSSAAFTLQPARVPLRFHLGWCKDPTFEAQAPCSMELLRDRMWSLHFSPCVPSISCRLSQA
jgi:hypothetical protein